MKKITIKELVTFRRKFDRTRKNFGYKLKSREEKIIIEENSENDGGGDYWITSTSCIYNVFKSSENELYDLKIKELRFKFENTEDKRTQSMYLRNIEILNSFKDFDFEDSKPLENLKYHAVPKSYKVLMLDVFPLYVNPSLLFTYQRDGKSEMGAIWFIPQLNGFKKSELGMFCEILYRFLVKNYESDYKISEEYCIAIDTYNAQKVSYTELLKGNIPFLINNTLDEIKNL